MSGQTARKTWSWPLNLAAYDRTPKLTEEEKDVLATFVRQRQTGNKRAPWFVPMQQAIPRLMVPLCDACDFLGIQLYQRNPVVAAFLQKMHIEQTSYWGFSGEQWASCFQRDQARAAVARYPLLSVLYLLGLLDDWSWAKQSPFARLAQQIFGEKLFQESVTRVSQALREQGYSEFSATRSFLPLMLGRILLEQRSPFLEDISVACLQRLYETIENANHRSAVRRLAYALFALKVIPEPISPYKDESYRGMPGMGEGIHPQWVAISRRWMETSTYRPETRKAYYRKLLQVGRWLATTHPDVTSPADWTRELAAEYIAMVDGMRVGDWTYGYQSDNIGNPISPYTKTDFITVMRIFCRDCQEWGWVRLQLDPGRSFSVPQTILSKIGPAPRVISDDMWAKILWAGVNLQPDDLLLGRVGGGEGPAYPLEMVRALAITWLFSRLRVNEICRLRLGCIRRQAHPETGQEVCLLTVPLNKTSGEYVKPVDPLVGRAIAAWEQARPIAPPMRDRKTGQDVQLLFAYRAAPIGRQYLNEVLIPLLCHKAGVPLADSRGRITSHRARATIASQLYNAREGMSLSELQAWLGHRVPESTQHYVAMTPKKQAEAYAAAGYLAHNKRLIEVLIDRDAVRQGQAQAGAPWHYYDVGHGHCHYDFFDQCPHRLACARCRFYLPKGSSHSQFLEARHNLQRMLQEVQLTEEEQAAVEDGVVVIDKLLQRLVDVPTPAGPTPRETALHERQLLYAGKTES